MSSRKSKDLKFTEILIKFLIYRLFLKKLWRILEQLKIFCSRKKYVYLANKKVRIWRTFDKKSANVKSKAHFCFQEVIKIRLKVNFFQNWIFGQLLDFQNSVFLLLGNCRSWCLDLHDQAANLEKTGQFRSTPPTHTFLAFKQALLEFWAEGGLEGRTKR